MERSVFLHDCRRLLREINCEAVVIDTTDQNLYDILISSEEKKTVLLTWLVQNLFTPAQCLRCSLEDLMSMFMTGAELASFLKGTMSVKDQFDKWILIMTTVKQTKEQPGGTNPRGTSDRILNGKLLDEYVDSWNQKVVKPSTSLHHRVRDTKNNIADLQNDLSAAEELLKQLNLSSDSNTELLVEPSVLEEEFGDLVPTFLSEYRILKEKVDQLIQSSSSSSEDSSREDFIEELRRLPILTTLRQNLSQLRDIMSVYKASKNSTD